MCLHWSVFSSISSLSVSDENLYMSSTFWPEQPMNLQEESKREWKNCLQMLKNLPNKIYFRRFIFSIRAYVMEKYWCVGEYQTQNTLKRGPCIYSLLKPLLLWTGPHTHKAAIIYPRTPFPQWLCGRGWWERRGVPWLWPEGTCRGGEVAGATGSWLGRWLLALDPQARTTDGERERERERERGGPLVI